MIHDQRLLVTSTLIICSLLASASSAQEATGLVLKGDACIRAEGLGQLERATLALWLQVHRLPGEFNSILHSDGWGPGRLAPVAQAEWPTPELGQRQQPG